MIIQGFRKCGIVPFNPSIVVDRLPVKKTGLSEADNEKQISRSVSETVVDMLSTMRYGDKTAKITVKRKKLNVAPGKGVTPETFQPLESVKTTSTTKQKTKKKKKAARTKTKVKRTKTKVKRKSRVIDSDDQFSESDDIPLSEYCFCQS